MRATLLATAALLLAGCTDTKPNEVNSTFDPFAPAEAELAADAHPLLVEATDLLTHGAAVIEVPAGSYRLVRLVFDENVWGEEEPWDGSASTEIKLEWDAVDAGVLMTAFGFAPASFEDDHVIRPYVDFYPIEEEGWLGMRVASSCSGCDESLPGHEVAFLLGSPNQTLTARLGLGWDSNLQTLTEAPVRADAQTSEAFAGFGFRFVAGSTSLEYVAGALEMQWGGTELPTFTGVQRTTDVHSFSNVTEPGIATFQYAARDAAGMALWNYSLQANGTDVAWQGPWVHTPILPMPAVNGVIWPPRAVFQGNIGTGTLSVEVHRNFIGQADPTGLAQVSYDLAMVGHAGLDLDALFDWRSEATPWPDTQDSAACIGSSLLVDATLCYGDPQAAKHLEDLAHP